MLSSSLFSSTNTDLCADAPKIKINLFYLAHGNVLPLLKIMYIYHHIPDYATSCIAILPLIQHIVVTLMGRSKTVVGFFPIAAICRVLPNKSQQEHVFYPLPWQMNKIFINFSSSSKCCFMPGKALFYRLFRHCDKFDTATDFAVNRHNLA